ncbi:type VII secretion-associated serine protease mycosin [Polymorphospora sp. NPDC051019]|uniref:type VII secretion-associated serine protease mycosin n=1 Tax=Polymorphospora sp. NPDC051019 TaxID=3155725 RepID=UPI00341F9B53
MTSRTLKTLISAACTLFTTLAITPPAHGQQLRDDQWHLRFLNVTKAHQITQGNEVKVAVIDTGVEPHPDLRENLLTGTDVAPGGTGDGREDADSHGTGMAGLIAAHGTLDEASTLGIAPKAKVIPIRDTTPTSTGDGNRLAAGIDWAIENGASVINISSAGGPTSTLRESVKRALERNIVIVASAGNRPTDTQVGFPAFLEGVVAVGAVDRNGNHSPTSVTGSKVEIVAPGVDIVSTGLNGGYRKGTGTSGAAAIVSGAAALVRSKFPDLSAAEVVHRLTATAVDKGPPGRDEQYGYGVLDLVAALTADVPPLGTSPGPSASPSASPSPSPSPSPSRSSAAGDGPDDRPSEGWRPGFFVLGAVAAAGLAAVALFVSRRRRRGAG